MRANQWQLELTYYLLYPTLNRRADRWLNVGLRGRKISLVVILYGTDVMQRILNGQQSTSIIRNKHSIYLESHALAAAIDRLSFAVATRLKSGDIQAGGNPTRYPCATHPDL